MKYLHLLSLFFFLIVSCKKDYEIVAINSDVLVSTEKVHSEVLLNAETEMLYGTLGHQITFCNKIKNKEIYIKFKKVLVPALGATALGPASCSINLGDLDFGEYAVTFELNKKKTSAKLIVGNTVELSFDSVANVKPQ